MPQKFHRSRSLPWRIVRWISLLVLVLLTFTALGNLAGSERWPLSKLVHFPFYWTFLAAAVAVASLLQRQWWPLSLALVHVVGFGVPVSALWVKPEVHPAGVRTIITVMTFNVFQSNRRYPEVLAALLSASPDVIYLTEMSPEWHSELAPLSKAYPHRVGERSNLLLSKFPMEDARRISVSFDVAKGAFRSINGGALSLDESLREHWWNSEVLAATVIAGGHRIRIAGIHPPIPGNETSLCIQRAVALVCHQELERDHAVNAKVMMGDFNTSRFSPTFRFILEHTGLRDSAEGFGYTPTWGPRMPDEPWLPWLGIPIDHVLVSSNVDVSDREVGPALGSDHRWVKATLRIAR